MIKKILKYKWLLIMLYILFILLILSMSIPYFKGQRTFSDFTGSLALLVSILSSLLSIFIWFANNLQDNKSYTEFCYFLKLILKEKEFNLKHINNKNVPIVKDVYIKIINMTLITNIDSKQNEFIISVVDLLNSMYLKFDEIKISNDEKYKKKLLKDIDNYDKQLIKIFKNNISKS